MICRNLYLAGPPCLSPLEADALDEEELSRIRAARFQGYRRSFAERAAVRLQGPLLRIALHSTADDAVGNHHPLGVGRRWLA